MLQSFDKLCFLSIFETSDRVLSHLVQFLFCLDLISRAAAIPLHCFPMKRAQLPDQTNKKTQIVSNFANPSIVLGTILLRQTESYFLFSPWVHFLFCSVQFCLNPIRQESGNPSSLFSDEKSPTPRSNKPKNTNCF